MTEAQAAATRFCARVIGPLLIIIGAIILARGGDIALIIPAILQDGALAFVTGIFTLIVGMVLFAAHHHWSSLPAIVISLLGMLAIVRGITLMLAPSLLAGLVHGVLTGPGPFVLVTSAVLLLLGAWLAFVGWFSKQPT